MIYDISYDKIYGDVVNNKSQNKKIPKTPCKCLSLIMLGSVIKTSKKYHPQTLLEECKYEIKETKMENLINNDLDPIISDNETDNDFDNEADYESDNDESND